MRYKDFIAVTPEEKIKNDPLLCRFILRPISFPFSFLLYRLGINANIVTWFGIITTIFVIFIDTNTYLLILIFFFLALLDCIDGNLARAFKKDNNLGAWLDAFSGYLITSVFWLKFTLNSFDPSSFLILYSGIGYVSANLLLRLLHQKLETFSRAAITTSVNRTFIRKVSGELSFVGFMLPLALIASITGKQVELLLCYLAITLIGYIPLIKKAHRSV